MKDKNLNYSNISKPLPPLTRIIKEGGMHFCSNCGSTMSKNKFWFGERLCDNHECPNSKTKFK